MNDKWGLFIKIWIVVMILWVSFVGGLWLIDAVWLGHTETSTVQVDKRYLYDNEYYFETSDGVEIEVPESVFFNHEVTEICMITQEGLSGFDWKRGYCEYVR